MLYLASWVDPVDATFILAVLVLAAGVALAIVAKDSTNSNQIYASVGVLFGLLAAGGLGGLFASQAATNAADNAAPAAAKEAAAEVSGEVTNQVNEALESPPQGSSGNSSGGGEKGQ